MLITNNKTNNNKYGTIFIFTVGAVRFKSVCLPDQVETLQGPFHRQETRRIGREGTDHDGAETAEHGLEAALGHYAPGFSNLINIFYYKHAT